MPLTFAGVDVSKATLEFAWAGQASTQRFPNTPAGRSALLRTLRVCSAAAPVQLVLEPTSTYHQHLVEALAATGLAFSVVNPARTAAFARVQGSRAKTDKADAKLLAAYGASQQPPASPPPDVAQEQMKALRRHKEWLEGQLQDTRNRLEAAQHSPWTPKAVVQSLRQTAKALERQIEQVQAALETLVASEERWQRQITLLVSIPGIGVQTAILLLSELPPVDRCASAKTWVAFCGINPTPYESGKHKSSRLSRAGSTHVRAGLYWPTIVSTVHNPLIHPFNVRLQEAGKLGKVRIMAAMNKLLHLCFAVLKRGTPFVTSLTSLPNP